jgi:hypothetical protein
MRCDEAGEWVADDYSPDLLAFYPRNPDPISDYWVYHGVARFGGLRCTSDSQVLTGWETRKRYHDGDWISVPDPRN